MLHSAEKLDRILQPLLQTKKSFSIRISVRHVLINRTNYNEFSGEVRSGVPEPAGRGLGGSREYRGTPPEPEASARGGGLASRGFISDT